MAANDALEVPSFETHEAEVKFWRERYLEMRRERNKTNAKYQELEEKYQELGIKFRRLESCHMCTNEDPEHPVKIDNITMDPLVKLEEPVAHKIMKYLSGKELLDAMQVSQGWKRFIEERPSLMNRAMDQIVVKPNLEGWSIPLIKYTFVDGSEVRPYRHMQSPLFVKYPAPIFSIARYAATLESLTIPEEDEEESNDFEDESYDSTGDDDDDDHDRIEEVDFPKLRSLVIDDCDVISRFKNCSFPVLTHLRFESDNIANLSELRAVLRQFPQLVSLDLTLNSDEIYDDTLVYDDDKQQPKIQKITIGPYFAPFLKDQHKSLQVLHVPFLELSQLRSVLRDLKSLVSLTSEEIFVERSHLHFPVNTSIEYLNIRKINFDREQSANLLSFLRLFLVAIPSAKEFVFHSKVTKDIINAIAINTTSLKKLVCPQLDEEAMDEYRSIQANPYQYKNAKFEVAPELNDPEESDDSDSLESEEDEEFHGF